MSAYAGCFMKDDYLVEGFITKNSILSEEPDSLYSRELYHRVKNDITLLTSYLSLKENELESDSDKHILRSVISQFKALTSLYDIIVSSSMTAIVHLEEVLERMIGSTLALHGAHRDISVDFCLEDACLASKQALPLLLVCNELITNAIKHSSMDKVLSIKIELKNSQKKAILKISSNSGDFDPHESRGYGLMLVEALAAQAGAKLEFSAQDRAWLLIFNSLC